MMAIARWKETNQLLAYQIKMSYEEDVVNGNEFTKSRWYTYASLSIGSSLFTRNADKAAKAGKFAKAGKVDEVAFLKQLSERINEKIRNEATELKPGSEDYMLEKQRIALEAFNKILRDQQETPPLSFADANGRIPVNVLNPEYFRDRLEGIVYKSDDSTVGKGVNTPGTSDNPKSNNTSEPITSIDKLKNTDKFRRGALEHILEGQLNARGKAVGYHSESIPDTPGRIIPGTESAPNKYGVYKAKIEVNNIPKTANGGESTFFPENWDAQKIVESINEAFENRQFIEGTRNTFIGELSNGMQIQMYIDMKSGKIISSFSIY
ncbi:EndoU domain-containing protein [Sporolactobacillus sp. THM19-2]|uniref:EndoU domain-containing protein n=1 Tax=Sporolactobacillus sp. THM19-2 TaxID=2511171 RepID=UPI001020EB38|nr:EndoU domain-containing protein [Sporolactobacillus sp. THM19-2]RYL93282.1 hypothetical protein EWH91_05410 [Sporolactobacillus sp. THM19-2]